MMPGVPVLTLGAGGADSGVTGGVEGHAACQQGDEADGSGGCVGGGVGGDPEHREALTRLDTARSGRLRSMLHRYLVCMSRVNKPKADTEAHEQHACRAIGLQHRSEPNDDPPSRGSSEAGASTVGFRVAPGSQGERRGNGVAGSRGKWQGHAE